MRALAFPLLTLLPSLLAAANLPTPKDQIIAYVFVKDRAIQPNEIAANKLTRINYAFANLQGGRIVEGFAHDRENFAALNDLKKQNPALTVLVSVGGWTWSGNFSDMALTKQSRKVFVDSAVGFIVRYKLDGLDIDWEYPGMSGDNNKFRAQDKKNYTSLLKELRRRFDKEEVKLNRHLFTSVAAGASARFLAHTEMRNVQKYVDTVNLMAYDYYEPDSDKTTGNHAPLYPDPTDPKHISADTSVREYEAAGVRAEKIVLGVPFYGHTWGDVADRNHGLFQPGKSVADAFANSGSIANGTVPNGYTRFWDDTASVPYLYNASSRMFISYEDEESVALKCKYVQRHGLAGVMFWDYSGDTSGKLLDAINAALRSVQNAKAASH
jgi:chitinase